MNNLQTKDRENLPEMLEIWQQTLQWQPDQQQQQQFQDLYQGIVEENRHLNLTRITEAEEFWEKHLWDSLVGLGYLGLKAVSQQPGLKVIDIGTGGGFPGLPVAIACPECLVTLLDSTRKKIAFLESLSSQLGITNVQTISQRAEAIGQDPDYRENYDLALIRAVGEASVCAEYALPLVKIGGLAILYRGHWAEAETEKLEAAVTQLGGKIETITTLKTPLSQSMRHCLYLRKITPTPAEFPRAIGIPNQQPL